VRRGGERAVGRHPRLRDAPAGQRRLCTRHAKRDRRCAVHDGDRRDDAEGLRLVRQRDGLCLPDGRSRLPDPTTRRLMMTAPARSGSASPAASSAARNYAIVTAAYWGFTLTEGALRMLVLLHFYRLGYSPFTLAFLFLLYEAA